MFNHFFHSNLLKHSQQKASKIKKYFYFSNNQKLLLLNYRKIEMLFIFFLCILPFLSFCLMLLHCQSTIKIENNLKTVFALETIIDYNENYFAQIQTKNVFLYNAPFGTPIFEIPETYYVKLLENSKNGFYKAQYIDIIGYVMETEIQCVANPPANPFLSTVSFRNYGAQSSELRTEPTRLGGTSTLICELPLYETNFTFYGKISGEEVVPNRSDLWFYCSYTKNNQTKKGYIYSGLIDMMTTYISNPIDSYPILKHEWRDKEKQNENTSASLSLPNKKQTLIIIAITIPIIALLALMFKPMQAKKQQPNSNKNSNKYNSKQKKLDPKHQLNLENPRYTATTLSQPPRYTAISTTQSQPSHLSTKPIKQHQNLSDNQSSQFNRNTQPAPQNYFSQTHKPKKGKDFYEL